MAKRQKEKPTRILVLFSGGLDSVLAARLLQDQDIEVTGLTFTSYFFNAETAKKTATQIRIDLKILDISDEQLAFVKNPPHGHGKAMNPCIDCHALMLKKAKEVMEKENYDGVATGEVLRQRPMSQNKEALGLIAKESGLNGYLLRPLSAKALKPTLLEEEGLVDRERLLGISGRGRKEQIALAEKWHIKEYPSPAGGCLLTDPQFGFRLKEMLDHWPDADGFDVETLKIGRHFWVGDNQIVLGRNHQENLALKETSQKGNILIEPEIFPGPSALIRSKGNILEKSIKEARDLILKYSPKADRKK